MHAIHFGYNLIFLNGLSLNAIIMFQTLGKRGETFMLVLHMLLEL